MTKFQSSNVAFVPPITLAIPFVLTLQMNDERRNTNKPINIFQKYCISKKNTMIRIEYDLTLKTNLFASDLIEVVVIT